MSIIDTTYLRELAHGVTEFKGASVEDLIDYLQDEYPPEPEEVLAQEQLLQKDWDPNNHIESLFDSVKKGVETLLQMDAIDFNNMDKTSVEYIYNAIRSTGQFDPACFKWKALPPDERATLRQIRTYFGSKYKVYDTQRKSLHQAGVANSVQLQELQQATRDELANLREEQAEFNSALIDMVQDKKDGGMDDAATSFSAMTAHSALKDRQIEELEAQNTQLRSSSNSTIATDFSTRSGGTGRGGGACRGAGRGAGRGQGTGRGAGRGNYRCRSDGPPNCTKMVHHVLR
jgi:hypothetical protein